MISLEQVKLLETRVARAIEYVERVTGENDILVQREAELRAKLDSYQKRIDELEVAVMRFKEDQGRIEDGILAALDRLNQFEESVEKSLNEKQAGGKKPAKPALPAKPDKAQEPPVQAKEPPRAGLAASGEIFFEIPEAQTEQDIADPLTDEDSLSAEGELDIF
jgi:peptidoglycan hydrolase CwlO-like protein